MTKLYEPHVLGAGITIEEKPTLPNHGARLVDVQSYATITKATLTNVLKVVIPVRSPDYIVQCFDAAKQIFYPDSVQEVGTNIEIKFLESQSGEVRVLFIGGDGGD